ncbi:MAG: alginate export family protein [Phycisphaerales bacterium]|nr:MAG: alginate export family protein [Phycisphaerales bacterium]
MLAVTSCVLNRSALRGFWCAIVGASATLAPGALAQTPEVAGAQTPEAVEDAVERPAPPAPAPRPALQMLRFSEDWSVLRGQELRGLDRLKFIPLDEEERVFLSVGGQQRLRFERFENFGFNPANDDTYLLSRTRLHMDLQAGEHLRAFVEVISANTTGRDLPGGKRPLDVDTFDLLNAFGDVRFSLDDDARLTLRLGRHELLFGRQRLVSPLDWVNSRRTFEGVSAILDWADWRISGFWTRPVTVRKYDWNKAESGGQFFGVYAATKPGPVGFDLYWLGVDRDRTTIASSTGSEHRHTLGARSHGLIAETGLDFDVEAALQFGRHDGRDVFASMFSAEVGYRFTGAPWRPRLSAGFDYASGDRNAGNGEAGTFNQLFPLGHAFFGAVDLVGRQNIVAARVGLSVSPHETLTLSADGHFFWRAETGDALYNAGGGVVRGPAPGASREVGQELELAARYNPGRGWSLMAGYSRFFAGKFIEDTGPSEDVDFLFTSVQFTF